MSAHRARLLTGFVVGVFCLQAISFVFVHFFPLHVIVNARALFGVIGQSELIVTLMLAAGILLVRSWRVLAEPPAVWGFLLMVMGGLSNLLDRLIYGGVIDMVPFFGWFTFNLADVCITVGLVSLLITSFQTKEHVPGIEHARGEPDEMSD